MSDESEYEFCVKVITMDADFPKATKQIEDEGYEAMPGFPTVVTFILRRRKRSPKPAEASGMGRLVIDDSKVMVVPAKKN